MDLNGVKMTARAIFCCVATAATPAANAAILVYLSDVKMNFTALR